MSKTRSLFLEERIAILSARLDEFTPEIERRMAPEARAVLREFTLANLSVLAGSAATLSRAERARFFSKKPWGRR